MAEEMKAPNTKGKSSQTLIPLKELRDGVIILKDGTMRVVLMVSSINFALKSQEEQDAIIFAYQDFLNSLDFPIQITVSSRKADITPYLEEVKRLRDEQKNELLRVQMGEYINFISELVKGSNIMTKTFFVTIPFSATQAKQASFLDKFFKGARAASGRQKLTDQEFDHYRSQIFQRAEQIATGLRGIGLRVIPLKTQELLELFYNFYNPRTSRNQRLKDVSQLRIEETER